VRADPGGDSARAAASQLLREHGVRDVPAALAAVLLLVLQAEVAQLRAAVEHLVGKPARVLPLTRVRVKLGLHESPHALAEVLVLLRERRDRASGGSGGKPLLAQRAHSVL